MLQERGEDEKAVSWLSVRRSKIHLHLLGNLFTRKATYAALTRGTVVITLSDSLHLWASLRFSTLGHPMFLQFPFTHPTWCHDPISFFPPYLLDLPVSSHLVLVLSLQMTLQSLTFLNNITFWPNLISLSSLQALPLPNFPLFMNRTTVQSHNLDKKESPPTVRSLLEPQWQSITSYGFSFWHSMPSHVPFLTLLLQFILLLCLDFSGLLTGFIPFVYTMLTLVIHTNLMTRTVWSLQSRHTGSSWTVPGVSVSAI